MFATIPKIGKHEVSSRYPKLRILVAVLLLFQYAAPQAAPPPYTVNTENTKSEIENLKANTTISKKSEAETELLETTISAYKAVGCAASEMNGQMRRLAGLGKIENLLVFDPVFVDTLTEYAILMNQLGKLEEDYLTELPPESKGTDLDSLLVPTEKIKDFLVDTMALFKTDTSITGTTVVVARAEFIAKAVKDIEVKVYYPYKAIPFIFANKSNLMEIVRRLAESRFRAARAIAANESAETSLKLEELNKQHTKLLTQLNIITETEPRDQDLSPDEFESKDASERIYYDEVPGPRYKFNQDRWKQYRNYKRQRNTVDYLRAEMAFDLLTSGDPRKSVWLDVNIAEVGGNYRIKKNPVIDILRGGNSLKFSAGAVVSYRIFNSSGEVLASDTIMTYMPYKGSANITEFVCKPTVTGNRELVP
jgi:hypothetical protein